MKTQNSIIKKVIIAGCVIFTLALGGSIVVGGLISDKILHQNKGKDTCENSIKQLEKWGYDLDAFNNKYEGTEIKATAEDGNVVPATFFDGESEKCAVLIHGAGGDRVSIYPLAEQYIERGYDVIAIDQRGCGTNADDQVTFGIHEALDVEAMVSYAREELHEDEVIVHGQSMGAQTAVIYAANVKTNSSAAADAVIADSPVPGMELILREMFADSDDEEKKNSLLNDFLIGTSKTFMKIFNKVDYDDADTIAVAKDIELPTMIIVSDKDETCLPKYVEMVYDNMTCEKRSIAHFDSSHIEGVIDDPEGYMDSVETFLASVEK